MPSSRRLPALDPRRWGLRARLSVPVITLVLAAVVILGAAQELLARAQEKSLIHQRGIAVLEGIVERLGDRHRSKTIFAQLLAEQPDLANLVERRDTIGLAQVLIPLRAKLQVGQVHVYGIDGHELLQLGPADERLDERLVVPALRGMTVADEGVSDRGLMVEAVAPIKGPRGVVGALLVGTVLSGNGLKGIGGPEPVELALFRDGQLVGASTVSPMLVRLLADWSGDPHAMERLNQQLEPTRYHAEAKVLDDGDVLVALVPTGDLVWAARERMLLESGIGGGLLLFVLIVALGLARNVALPLERVAAGTRELLQGTHQRLSGSRVPEVDDLATAINHLSERVESQLDALSREIAEREQAAAGLRTTVEHEAAIAQLGRFALSESTTLRLMDRACAMVIEHLGAERSELLELLPDRLGFAVRARAGWPDELPRDQVVPVCSAPQPAFTLAANTPVISEDLARESRFGDARLATDCCLVSSITVVVPGPDRPFGVLGAYTTVRRTFGEEAEHFLEAVANIVATAVERHRTEEERARLLRELSELEARREADRITSEFVTVASHEFRTPLASIVGFSELLLTRQVTEADQRKWIRIMHAEALRLNQLLQDLLDVSRILQGGIKVHPQSVDAAQAVNAVLDQVRGASSKHQFVMRSDGPLPGLWVDPQKLRRILDNLISNAVKYSPDGGCVSVTAERQDRFIRLSVTDQGLGIPEDQLPLLFRRFHRIDESARRPIRGSGLGLYITKQLVEMQGGRVWGESPGPGRGSTFHVALPIAEAQGSNA